MKITTRYIVGIVILVVGLFAILLIRPSRFVWTPTFAHEDKNPLGCFVFDSVMVQTMPRGYKATSFTMKSKTSSPITATTSMTPSTIGRSTRTPMAPNATVFPVASPIPMPTTAYTKRSSPVLSISILLLQSIAAITS